MSSGFDWRETNLKTFDLYKPYMLDVLENYEDYKLRDVDDVKYGVTIREDYKLPEVFSTPINYLMKKSRDDLINLLGDYVCFLNNYIWELNICVPIFLNYINNASLKRIKEKDLGPGFKDFKRYSTQVFEKYSNEQIFQNDSAKKITECIENLISLLTNEKKIFLRLDGLISNFSILNIIDSYSQYACNVEFNLIYMEDALNIFNWMWCFYLEITKGNIENAKRQYGKIERLISEYERV